MPDNMVLLENLQLRTYSIEYMVTIYGHYNFIESNFERNNKLASLFLDLKKAFDLVDHKILLNKLKYHGFRASTTRLIES